MSEASSRRALFAALRISFFYLLTGVLWIGVFDAILESWVESPQAYARLKPLEDFLFVLLTAAFLLHLVYRTRSELYRSREVLLGTRQWFEALGEHVSDVVWAFDDKRRYVYVSSSVRVQRGFTPEEIMQAGVDKSVHDNDRARLRRVLDDADALLRRRAADGAEPLVRGSLEMQLRRADGSFFPAEIRYTVLGYPDGRVRGYVGVTRDITERRQAEEALRQETERARRYLALAPVLFVGLDAHLRATMVNRKTCELLGYDESEILGTQFVKRFVPPRENSQVGDYARKLVAEPDGNVEYYENHLVTRDGRERLIAWHNSQLCGPDGEILGCLSAGEDITEQRAAEEALRKSEAVLRALLDAIPDIAFLMQPDGAVVAANEALAHRFNMTVDQIVGTVIYDLLPPDLAESRRCALDDAINARREVRFQDVSRGAHYDHCASPVFGPNGRVALVAVLARDITEYVRALEAREAAMRDLADQRSLAMRADRLRSLGEMAAGIAHEINQPLVGVRGLAEHMLIALERRWELNPERIAENLQTIVEQVDRMSHIVDHVRLFSRQAGSAERYPIDINDVVQSSLTMISAQMRTRGIVLETDLAEGLPRVMANPFSAEEVLINLLTNARDAVEERRDAEGAAPEPHIVIRTASCVLPNGRGTVRLEVADQGAGIDPAVMERVFEPFFTTKTAEKGTGLGLSIARSIIEDLEGTISIDSSPGVGTTIRIELGTVIR